MIKSVLQNSIDQYFHEKEFELSNGIILPELKIAYITLGKLNASGSNAILLTHGYSSSHRLSKSNQAEASEGGWNLLVGPGKPIDTDKYFVISSNMLGSSYGSSGPSSINPSTGKFYNFDFPEITFKDIVQAQYLLLKHLGVTHLKSIVGASYGGYQAFQWAIQHPEMMNSIVCAMSSIWPPNDGYIAEELKRKFNLDGKSLETIDWTSTMTDFRVEMLKSYGAETTLLNGGKSPDEAMKAMYELAKPWAEKFNPNSLLILHNAAKNLDLEINLNRIKAKVLCLLSTSDQIFPATLGPRLVDALQSAGVDVQFRLLESDRGHRASHEDASKWASDLENFLNQN